MYNKYQQHSESNCLLPLQSPHQLCNYCGKKKNIAVATGPCRSICWFSVESLQDMCTVELDCLNATEKLKDLNSTFNNVRVTESTDIDTIIQANVLFLPMYM